LAHTGFSPLFSVVDGVFGRASGSYHMSLESNDIAASMVQITTPQNANAA
jgi:hypothetical protein